MVLANIVLLFCNDSVLVISEEIHDRHNGRAKFDPFQAKTGGVLFLGCVLFRNFGLQFPGFLEN